MSWLIDVAHDKKKKKKKKREKEQFALQRASYDPS